MLDYYAAMAVILFIIICFSMLHILKSRQLEVSPAALALTVLPVFIYMIFSGALAEFSGGGITAKFREISRKPIATKIIEHSDIVGTHALSQNIEIATFFAQGQAVLAIDGDAWERLSNDEAESHAFQIAISIYQSLLTGSFEGLLVVDSAQKPLGFFDASYFLELLRIPLDRIAVTNEERDLVMNKNQIRAYFHETNVAALLKNPKIRAKLEGINATADYNTPLLELLNKLKKDHLNSIVLIDFRGAYVGVVSRERLVEAVLIHLLEL